MDLDSRLTASVRPPRVAPVQAMALGLVVLACAAAAWTLRVRPAREETELLPGSVLPQSELAIMEAAFDRAQLTDHRSEGGRVYVPRARHSAYMRALVDAEALPREFGASLRRALASNGPWTSAALRADSLRVAVQDELSLVLCSMPGIERAAVLYDDAPRAGLAGGVERTASVSIRTQPDTDLDPARVQAIRILVAAAIAGLSVERVAVTDLRSGRVYAGPLDPSEGVADPARAARLGLERATAAKVRQALGFIRGVVVDVTLGTAAAPAAAAAAAGINSPAAVGATVPATAEAGSGDSVHVLVAVPDTYLESVVTATRGRRQRRGEATWTEEDRERAEREEIDRLTQLVAAMLPEVADATRTKIAVTPFTSGLATSRPVAADEPAVARSDSAVSWPWGRAGNASAAALANPTVALTVFSLAALALAAVLWRAGNRRPVVDPAPAGLPEGVAAKLSPEPPARWREAA